MNYFVAVLKNYAVFTGRARRAEYWNFVLFSVLLYLALLFIVGFVDATIRSLYPVMVGIIMLYWLALIVPSIAVGVRRLHDIGKSGWWLLMTFIPFVGSIVLLVFACMDSQPGDNQYGPNPKGVVATGMSASVEVPAASEAEVSSENQQ